MLVLGARVIPWVLLKIARMQSRELFLLVALTLSLGIALTAATMFGVSIALGAFLAGIVVAESPLSHQVGADVLPFREAFAVLFFVSVGMLVDPRDIIANAGHVALLTTIIVVGKGLVALGLTLLLRQPALTALVVAAGLAQIGEFSFILGQAAVRLHMMTDAQYSLLLAAALLSITVNPLLFKLVPRLERVIGPRLGARPSMDASIAPTLRDHVVGGGRGPGRLPHRGRARAHERAAARRRVGRDQGRGPAEGGRARPLRRRRQLRDPRPCRARPRRALVVTIPDDPAPAWPWPRRAGSRLPSHRGPRRPRRRG
jgi:CPA2 family monovalent cation:H+ antiporter-2